MVRFFTISFLLSVLLFANLQETIKSFVSSKVYAKQENLIKVLFRKGHNFYKPNGENVDSLKVIKTLEDNGLFKLFYDKPISLTIKFITQKNALIFMKVISQSLEAIGYNYFLTSRATKSDDKFVWIINLHTRHLVNPVLFAKELDKHGCIVEDVNLEGENSWVYKINSDRAKLNAKDIDLDTSIKLKKPIDPYMIYAKSAMSITFRTSFSDHWFPDVIFLDKALHVVSQMKINKRTYVLKLDIPQSTVYIRVGDMYSLDNIKHGLRVYLKSKN